MLTPLELDIMKAIWHHRPITVRDVQHAIRPSRNLAYTTVMTIMDRLYNKGFLSRTLRSRTHYYEPVVDYAEVRDEAVESLIKNFFGSKEKLQQFLDGESADIPLGKVVTAAVSSPSMDETLL
jgi:predicted transcriptional regulator